MRFHFPQHQIIKCPPIGERQCTPIKQLYFLGNDDQKVEIYGGHKHAMHQVPCQASESNMLERDISLSKSIKQSVRSSSEEEKMDGASHNQENLYIDSSYKNMLRDLGMMLQKVQSMPDNKIDEDQKISIRITPVQQSVQQLQVVMKMGEDSSQQSNSARS